MSIIRDSLHRWIPYKLAMANGQVRCNWVNTRDTPFTDPFFDETIMKCLESRVSGTPGSVAAVEMLAEWGREIDAVPPTAFIFHVSRCGSTLVSQALGMSPYSISVSEVPLFDELLRLPLKSPGISATYAGELLAGAIRFYGARRTGSERRLFIKTDSWHLMFHQQLRALYPHTPFIILYREPAAVLESNKRKNGIQGTAGLIEPSVYGFDQQKMTTIYHPDDYMAAVLEQFYKAIIEKATTDGRTLLLNYNQGLTEMMRQISGFTGTPMDEHENLQIAERARYHGKYPGEKFVERNTTSDRYDGTQLLSGLYNQIETLRIGKINTA